MLKSNQPSHDKSQNMTKPDINDFICQNCEGEIKQSALYLADYFKQMKMKPSWASSHRYALTHKGKRVGYFRVSSEDGLENNYFDIEIYPVETDWYVNYLENKPQNEKAAFMDMFENAYLKHCKGCTKCSPGKDMIIGGKEYKNICKYGTKTIVNPNEKHIQFIKALVDLRREYIKHTFNSSPLHIL